MPPRVATGAAHVDEPVGAAPIETLGQAGHHVCGVDQPLRRPREAQMDNLGPLRRTHNAAFRLALFRIGEQKHASSSKCSNELSRVSGREAPGQRSPKIGGFDGNEIVAMDGWVHAKTAISTNPPPWNNDIWFHLANHRDGFPSQRFVLCQLTLTHLDSPMAGHLHSTIARAFGVGAKSPPPRYPTSR